MKKNKNFIYLFFLCTSFLFFSCDSEDIYIPRKTGYFRIQLPEKKYQQYNSDCPFTFEYPTYAVVNKDEDPRAEPCWLNIDFPKFNARIHLSYKKINNNLSGYLNDAHELASKHQIKASGIDEMTIKFDSSKVYGLFYDIQGNAASSLQFYVSDSTSHFLRGALYFNIAPNADSIAPVVDYIRQDIRYLTKSLRWSNTK